MSAGAVRRCGSMLLLGLVVGVAPAAAADPPDPGSIQRSAYDSRGNAYPYVVYVPTTYDAARPAPLVVMTHGCQTTADQQMRANLYNGVAEREGIVMLYPDVDAEEASQPGPTQRCWQFPDPESWGRDSGDAAAIAGMTRAVMAKWHIDPERVYMVGMSAGSFMTSIMSAAYPDLFAAVAINAGGAYADGTCLFIGPGIPVGVSAELAFKQMGARARIVPRLVSGGDKDQGIPPACADKALLQGLRTDNLVLNGRQDAPISLTPARVREVPKPGGYSTTVSTYLDPGGCVIGERWLIHGMNHFWPGGSTDPQLKDFTDPKGPNGAELTWSFLRGYTKSTTSMPCAEAPVPAPAPAVCPARWLSLKVPAGASSLRATVNGHPVRLRVSHGRVRIRLAATSRSRTSVVVRGRTAAGTAFTRRRTIRGCGRAGDLTTRTVASRPHPRRRARPRDAGGGAQITGEQKVKDRVIDLTIATAAFAAPTKVEVILPVGYDADSSRRWPVTYFTAGTMNHYNSFRTIVAGDRLAERYPSIIVSPDANSGYWSDWYNGGAFGPPKYETFVIDQLIPLIDARFRTIADRAHRLIAGVSMGGYGSMMFAAHRPDLFAAAATLSGAVDSNLAANGAVLSASSTFDGAAPDAIYGPRAEQEVRWRGHNPTDLANNLRGLDLQVRTANGVLDPGIGEGRGSGDLVSCVVEGGVHMASVDFHRKLDALHISHLWKDYGPGCHTPPNFEREVTETLAGFARVLADPPAPPATFTYTSIEPHFQIWGWHVDADPARALEFLSLKDAGRGGATFIGSGATTVTTPPFFRRARAVDVISQGTTRRRLRPDRTGRVRFTVDLGRAHPDQQYTDAARSAGDGTAGYFTTRTVSFRPHARPHRRHKAPRPTTS